MFSSESNRLSVVFKLCAAALWGAAKIFRQYEIIKTFYRNLADFSIKCCLMNKNRLIFFTSSSKASRSDEFLHPFQVFEHT
jgi:hypothetical protein